MFQYKENDHDEDTTYVLRRQPDLGKRVLNNVWKGYFLRVFFRFLTLIKRYKLF